MSNHKSQLKTGELIERLLKRGERVVVIGGPEPMVLLPLSEYEMLLENKTNLETAENAPYLESVDVPQGAVEDDDQYYPEPV